MEMLLVKKYKNEAEQLRAQLAKANEDYKTLFSAFESCQDELKESNERESVLSCQLDYHMERVAELEKENKRESMELRSRLGSALGRNSGYNSAIENMQEKLAKANERVAELEKQRESNYKSWQVKYQALKDSMSLTTCYECGTRVYELSPRSRCCMCEYGRAQFNERENEQLRKELL